MTDTDRELLELAAKAAELDVFLSKNGTFLLRNSLNPLANRSWNPLEDDGDAFRLAMSLRMIVTPGTARLLDGRLFGKDKDSVEETRRAIVMAAAYIGRTMQ
jgi:hypothetical protein